MFACDTTMEFAATWLTAKYVWVTMFLHYSSSVFMLFPRHSKPRWKLHWRWSSSHRHPSSLLSVLGQAWALWRLHRADSAHDQHGAHANCRYFVENALFDRSFSRSDAICIAPAPCSQCCLICVTCLSLGLQPSYLRPNSSQQVQRLDWGGESFLV